MEEVSRYKKKKAVVITTMNGRMKLYQTNINYNYYTTYFTVEGPLTFLNKE